MRNESGAPVLCSAAEEEVSPSEQEEREEEDREVTRASGEVCARGESTARSASIRKFLDFSMRAGVGGLTFLLR